MPTVLVCSVVNNNSLKHSNNDLSCPSSRSALKVKLVTDNSRKARMFHRSRRAPNNKTSNRHNLTMALRHRRMEPNNNNNKSRNKLFNHKSRNNNLFNNKHRRESNLTKAMVHTDRVCKCHNKICAATAINNNNNNNSSINNHKPNSNKSSRPQLIFSAKVNAQKL